MSAPVSDLAAACRQAGLVTLARIEARGGRPAALTPFLEFFRSGARAEEIRAGGRPLVAQVCNFLPEELCLAVGAVPVRLDTGCREAAEAAGPEVSPDGVCCAVRALLGGLGAGPWGLPRPELVVVPAACDGKRKLAGLWARRGGLEVAVLDLPREKRDARRLEEFHRQARALLARLERLAGRRAGRRELGAAVALLQRRATAMRALEDLRLAPVPALSSAEHLAVVQTSFLADTGWWVTRAEALADACRAAPARRGRPPVRLLLTGAPVLWPDFTLPLAAEEAGADFVAELLCSGGERLRHPPVVDERTRDGLLRAAVERVVLPSTCPCFAEGQDRLVRVAELARRFAVQGVVHHGLRGCAGFELDRADLAASVQSLGLPFLHLECELGQQQGDLLQNRLEAFVEVVRARAGPPG
jgi:benzoyl-CoA reductase/2-hydroxyglutaryl-CoA dehydratase subunit BcrC/BadD/HgdB